MSEIPGVVCRPCDGSSSDSRPARELIVYVNGDEDLLKYFGFQIKRLIHSQPDFLGRKGHYHYYAELYVVEKGEVIFDLWDPSGNIKQRHIIPQGSLILIPPGIAHRAYARGDLVMLAVTQRPYRPGSDIPADFEPVGPLPYGLS